MSDVFSLSFQGVNIIYIFLGMASLVISWWSYSGTVPQISSFKKYLLLILRSLGIFLIAILLIEPLLTVFSEKVTGSRIGVFVDISSSMNFKEKDAERYKTARDTYNQHKPSHIPASFYGFADTLIELNDFPDSTMFVGQATDIARVFTTSINNNEELGVLLFITDGANNIGMDPLKAASTIGLPVYSLVTGSSISRKDIFISSVDYPPVGYTNTEFQIKVEIGANGYQGKTGQLEIRDGKRVLGSQHVAFPVDAAYAIAEFKLSIADAGVKDLKAVISGFDDETYKDNNIRNFSIKFLKDKINILLLSSSLNWEFTYLKKVLEGDQHFKLSTAIARRKGGFYANELPASLDAWKEIELVITVDLDSRAIGSQLNNMKAAIESGTGFLYIAGNNSMMFRSGGWDKLLPVKPGSKTAVANGEFFPAPGKQARVRAIMDIEGLNWEELPPLKTVITGLDIDSKAIIFLDIVDDIGNHWPVLTGGLFERGKIAAMTGYPWWPRYFRPGSSSLDAKHMEKFWGNLVRWLVVREDLERFNLAPDKIVYKLGEPVNFAATVFDDNYNLLSGVRIEVVIADSSGVQRELQLTGRKPGQYDGTFGSPAAGKYNYDTYAIIDNDTLAVKSGSFIVESFGLEMENPSANFALMEQIAAVAGGKSYTPDNFNQFTKDLKLNIKKSDVFTEHRLTGNIYILLVIILLFALEWGIRKFSQLA